MKKKPFNSELCGTKEYQNVVPLWGKRGELDPDRIVFPWERGNKDFVIPGYGSYPAYDKMGEEQTEYLAMLDKITKAKEMVDEVTRRIDVIVQAQDVLSFASRSVEDVVNFIITELPDLRDEIEICTHNLKKYILINKLTTNEYQLAQTAMERDYTIDLYICIRNVRDMVINKFPDKGYGKLEDS